MKASQSSAVGGGGRRGRRGDAGFTLVEILIAIVLVGILSAVVVVGISNLTSKGSSSACTASLDAAKAGTAVYYATNQAYPTTLAELTTAAGTTPAALTLPTGVTVNTVAVTGTHAAAIGMQASSGTNWYLKMTAGTGGASPTFACS
ncbi:MAG TPA: type II secretion system protein [Ilumatobacteraceae bacterium]|jgi:prepilin-type N-terminal cleavage/methylation domain-containing protein